MDLTLSMGLRGLHACPCHTATLQLPPRGKNPDLPPTPMVERGKALETSVGSFNYKMKRIIVSPKDHCED